ncbi:MAG TPA: SH3 domain-containing protein [Gemmatimonadaceae bacterium]|nr:SH3 domain-containing protein [Gemmatimonadaceae bacterium]
MAAILIASLGAASAARAQLPAIATEAPLDVTQGVNFHALVRPDTVYVGQQASYQVGVFLNEDVRGRLRRNPEFVPPEMPGMLSYELPVAHALLPRGRGGQYEVHVFERAVFPLTPGTHDIPAARLSYSLPLTRGFFSREESHTLRSRPTRLVALAPPTAGRPAGYDGAVATAVSLGTEVDTARIRVGDPVLLTVRVSGTGNVNLFPRPRLDLSWGDAVAGDERVQLDSTARAVRGAKEFDWLVTPRREGEVVLPPIRYPYFDPYGESYEVAFTRPDTLRVLPGTLAALDTAAPAAAEPLPVRHAYRGEAPLPPSRSALYWLAVAALPLPAAALGLRRRRPRRPQATTAAQALAALAAEAATREAATGDAAGPAVSAGRVRALFTRALAGRLVLPPRALSGRGELARALRREGVSRARAVEVEAFLEELDRAAYASGGDHRVRPGMAARAAELYDVVDQEARRRTSSGGATGRGASDGGRGGGAIGRVGPSRLLVLLVALAAAIPLAGRAAAAVQGAGTTASPGALFADGVRAYEARRFDDAASLFSAVARRAPRSPDAWANLGTAAWSSGDSASAAVGWQRALRLEPTARDLRPRLALLPGAQLEGAAAVPPVSPRLLEWLALVAWAAAWAGAAWWLVARRAPRGGVPIVSGAGVAVALLVWAAVVLLDERLAARDLAVVATSGPARSTAALTAPAAGALEAGQVVRVRDRRGVWTRVSDGAGATGWVEDARLRELRRD